MSDIENEKQLIELEKVKATTAGVRSTGAGIAEAKSKAEADKIYYLNELDRATKVAQAKKIEQDNELALMKRRYESEINYIRAKNELEVNTTRELA